MSTSSTFFVTCRPAQGWIVPECQVLLETWLQKNCVSYVVAQEMSGHAKHVHMVFRTYTLYRKDSILRSLRIIIGKFYVNCQLVVKVALTEGSFFYTIKNDDIILSREPKLLLDYIHEDSARSLQVVDENKLYRDTKLKYAFDNKKTWRPYFRNCFQLYKRWPTIKEWEQAILLYCGKFPTNRYITLSYHGLYCQSLQTEKSTLEFHASIFEKKVLDCSEEPLRKKAKLSSDSDLSSSSDSESD